MVYKEGPTRHRLAGLKQVKCPADPVQRQVERLSCYASWLPHNSERWAARPSMVNIRMLEEPPELEGFAQSEVIPQQPATVRDGGRSAWDQYLHDA